MTRTSRRRFLQQVGAAAVATPLILRSARGAPSDKVNIACVGCGAGGKGESDMLETSVGNNIVALCDIDEQRLAQSAAKFPNAKTYTDWRKLLEQKDIDAVTVSTPDHTHAPVSFAAMSLGKHVYTQKPLTHNVYEARQLTKAAAEHKVITQMGIQHHATARLKTAVQIIRDDVIGKVSEVHTWTDRPGSYWKQGMDRPAKHDPVPSHVNWNQWLGVAPERPYVEGTYHPFVWRGWWDFGTGAMGDMGCHILDPVATALELPAPSLIWAEGPEPHPESGPTWCIVHYEFHGAKHSADTLHLTWYEAGKKPPRDLIRAPQDWKGSENGVLFVGEKGNLFVGFPELPELFPKEAFADYEMPVMEDHNHYTQWTDAILGKAQVACPFSYSGPLTEIVLLGNAAYRAQERLEWDSAQLKVKNTRAADPFLRRAYRSGWEVEGL